MSSHLQHPHVFPLTQLDLRRSYLIDLLSKEQDSCEEQLQVPSWVCTKHTVDLSAQYIVPSHRFISTFRHASLPQRCLLEWILMPSCWHLLILAAYS